MNNDNEHIDDIFKDHFEDYNPTPPGNVWSRVKSGLGNNNTEETLYNKFDKHQPQPPAWVWASLSNILRDRQRVKIYKRVAAAALFFASLGGLIASQFAANNTIDTLFAFEKDDNLIVKTTPINPLITQIPVATPGNITTIPTPKNYRLFTPAQPILTAGAGMPILENILADNNHISNTETPIVHAATPEIQNPEVSNLETIFANASVPTLGVDAPYIPQNNFNYKAPRYKKPSTTETSIEIFAGVANTFRQLDNKLDANVASIRKGSEKASYASQLGVKFNIIRNKLFFTNGLGFSQYNYTGTYVFQTQDIINLHPNFQSPNDPKGFKQEDYFDTVNQNKNKNVLTAYKFISLNTSIGYVINASKRMRIIPQIGVNAGYLVGNTGPKLNAGKPTEYSKMAEANSLSFNQRLMISSSIALKVNYKLSRNINLGIEPYINKQINEQTTTSPLGGQKLTAKGVNLSLSCKF